MSVPLGRLLSMKLVRSFGVYSVASLVGAAVPFVTIPIFTRVLSPDDFGLVSMFLVLVALAAPFTGLSIHGVIGVKYFDRDTIDLPVFVTSCLGLLAASALTVSLVLGIGSERIQEFTGFPGDWLWAVVATSAGWMVVQVVLVLWQMEGRATQYGLLQIGAATVVGGLGVLFVTVFDLGWRGRVGGQVLGTLIFACLGLLLLGRGGWLRLHFNSAYARIALAFGVPLIPHVVGAWVITMTDRIFITKFGTIAEMGIYAAGVQFAMIINMTCGSFNQAYVPWLFDHLSRRGDKGQIVRWTYAYFIGVLALAFALAWIAPLAIKYYMGPAFQGAHQYVIWIALGYAFNGMYKMVTNFIYYVEKTHILAGVTLLAGLLNVACNFVLVPRQGALGAAKAQAVAFLFSFILTWILSAKVYPMPWISGLRAREA